jgi:hypothetical protein
MHLIWISECFRAYIRDKDRFGSFNSSSGNVVVTYSIHDKMHLTGEFYNT